MTKAIALALSMIAAATTASAQGTFVPPPDLSSRGALTPLQASVARDLRYFGLGDVDVRDLSSGQVAAIHNLIHSDRSTNDIRRQVRSVAGRGLFSRHLNRR